MNVIVFYAFILYMQHMGICNVNQTELSWPIYASIDPAQERQKKPFFLHVHFWNLKCRKMRKESGCCSRATLMAPFIWMIVWKKKISWMLVQGSRNQERRLKRCGHGGQEAAALRGKMTESWCSFCSESLQFTVQLLCRCLLLSTWSRAALKWLFYDFKPEFAPSKCSNCTQVKKQLY